MRNSVLKRRRSVSQRFDRDLPPGGGLIIAGAASVLLWAIIAGVVVAF